MTNIGIENNRMFEFSSVWMKDYKDSSLTLPIDWLAKIGFFDAPASTKYHGTYAGGLYDHSFAVYKWLKTITENMNLQWQRPESPFIVGMFHDLCKCDQYKLVKNQDESHYEHVDNLLLTGHGAKSVMLLSTVMQLTEEEMLCIRYHMGAYEKDDWPGFDAAIRKYSTVLYTHTADMLASKVSNI